MRPFRALLHFLITLSLFLIAVNAVFSGWWIFPPDPIQNFITNFLVPAQDLSRNFVWRAIWAGVLVAIVLYWLLGLLLFKRRPKALQVRTAGGEMMLMHPGALLKFVRLQVESHPAVVSQRVKVRQKGSRGLSVWVWVNVRPIDSLPAIKHQIEESIRNGFSQVMGIEKIDEITTVIGLDEKSLTQRPGPALKAEPRPEPPVRGSLEASPGYGHPATASDEEEPPRPASPRYDTEESEKA